MAQVESPLRHIAFSLNQDSGWRYHQVKEGRGFQTGSLTGPFYACAALSGKRGWHRLEARTFADTQKELIQLDAALAATAQGLPVAEMEERTNANRVPLRRAVKDYLDQKRIKARKTRLKYEQPLNRFVEPIHCSVRGDGPMGAGDLGATPAPCSTEYSGSYARVIRGTICRTATRLIRPVIAAFSAGSVLGCFCDCSKNSPRTYAIVARSI